MEKSANLVIVDLRKELYETINRSGLPITIIAMLINEMASQLSLQTNQIVETERLQYENNIKLEQEKQENENK